MFSTIRRAVCWISRCLSFMLVPPCRLDVLRGRSVRNYGFRLPSVVVDKRRCPTGICHSDCCPVGMSRRSSHLEWWRSPVACCSNRKPIAYQCNLGCRQRLPYDKLLSCLDGIRHGQISACSVSLPTGVVVCAGETVPLFASGSTIKVTVHPGVRVGPFPLVGVVEPTRINS